MTENTPTHDTEASITEREAGVILSALNAYIEANPVPADVAAIVTRQGVAPEVVKQLAAALPGVAIIAHDVIYVGFDVNEMARYGWVRNPECGR